MPAVLKYIGHSAQQISLGSSQAQAQAVGEITPQMTQLVLQTQKLQDMIRKLKI